MGNTNYSPTGILSIYLNGILMPGNPMGSTTATIGFSNGEPIVAMWDDFREHVIFNGKSYNDVYITIGKNGLERKESYSEIDLNSELGVVAFCDEKNTLWNLDRIEQ
ncbi:MAG: hypothetical protein R2769_04645 [Saprospiraceae bacterium]